MRVGFGGVGLVVLMGAAQGAPLDVPFNFSRSEIELAVNVKGTPLTVLLDTGVDPSVIDMARTESLRLPIDKKGGGEVSGEGSAKSVIAYPSTIAGLVIAGRSFKPVEALANDLSALSGHYGAKLDGVLGYSFLKDQTLLVDYAKSRVTFFDRPDQVRGYVKTCKKNWSIPLKGFEDDPTPAVPFRFGQAEGLISLDTGSSGTMTLYPDTLKLAGVKAALVEKGVSHGAGARGTTTVKSYLFNSPVSVGPFTAPPGQSVVLSENKGFSDPRVANVGNKFFAALGLKILFDYRGKTLSFYGGC